MRLPALALAAAAVALAPTAATASPTPATPTVTATPHRDTFCSFGFTWTLTPEVLSAGSGSTLVTSPFPAGTMVRVYAYTRPGSEYRLVRETAIEPGEMGEAGRYGTTLWPPRNTRLYVEAESRECRRQSLSRVLPVRPTISIAADRQAAREYSFSGRVMPAKANRVVSLYRVEDGRDVLTAQGRVAADGTYRIDRTFLGSGRFGFFVRTGQDMENLEGRSRVRPTVVH